MSASEDERVERAAELLERLISDAEFRARFRAAPEQACREAGLADLADEIAMGGGALQTLEVRESKSSLLGVLMAAAFEGMGVIELSHLAGHGLSGEAAHVAHIATTRAGMRAVHPGAGLHGPHLPHVPGAPHLPHAPHVPQPPHLPHAPHLPHSPVHAGAPQAPGGGAGTPDGPGAGAGQPPAAGAAGQAPGGPAAAASSVAPGGPGSGAAAASAGAPAAPADAGWPDSSGAPAADQAGWGAPAGGGDQAGWPDAAGGGGGQARAAIVDPSAAADPSAVPASAPVDPSAVPAPAAAGGAGGGAIQQLVDQHRLSLPPGIQPDSFVASTDPRLVDVLQTIGSGHQLGLKTIDGGGIDIVSVDGLPVGPDNPAARELLTELAAMDPSQRPTQVGGPWALSAPGFFSDPVHQDHIHLGFDAPGGGAAAGGGAEWGAATAATPGAAGGAQGTIQFAAVDPSQQRAGAGAAAADAATQQQPAGAGAGGADAAAQQQPGGAGAGAGAVVDAAAPRGGGGFDVAAAGRDYPGNGASKAQIARWMGDWAERAGLPRELPVMASLVEGGMQNVQYGDADSLGYFQMRTSVWSGQYPDFQHHPEQQLKWFIDQALAMKHQLKAQGQTAFEHDPSQYGNWIADIERPAAQYRGRYQLRLGEAQSLLAAGGSAPPASAPVAEAAAAPSAAPAAPPAGTPPVPAAPGAPAATGAAPGGGTISFIPAVQEGTAGAGAGGATGQAAAEGVAATPGVPAGEPPLLPGSSVTMPGTAAHELRQIFERAAELDSRHLPYLWGGGHDAGVHNVFSTGPLDCSGSVSAVLGVDPRVSTAFESWGLAGPGQHVTVYANPEHVLMEINGHFFGTSAANPGGGAGWIPREHIPASYLAGFVARHPAGL